MGPLKSLHSSIDRETRAGIKYVQSSSPSLEVKEARKRVLVAQKEK